MKFITSNNLTYVLSTLKNKNDALYAPKSHNHEQYLTKTEQTLTTTEKDQVRSNLGYIGRAAVAGETVTVDGKAYTVEENAEIFGDYVNNIAIGAWSIAEGSENIAVGRATHVEGAMNKGLGTGCHVEGVQCTASGYWSHAEGEMTNVTSYASHAEGSYTTLPDGGKRYGTASGYASHVEGGGCHASGSCSHAEGLATTVSGNHSHVEGKWTVAASSAQHVEGTANIEDAAGKYIHIAGNGSWNSGEAVATRSNAYTLDWNGNGWFAGNVSIGADNKQLATEEFVNNAIDNIEIPEGFSGDYNDLTNRPCYEEQGLITYTFDGNTDGKITVPGELERYVKISDDIDSIQIDSIEVGKVKYVMTYSDGTIEETEANYVELCEGLDGKIGDAILIDMAFYIVLKDNFETLMMFNEVTFPEKGIYVAVKDGYTKYYVSNVSLPGSTVKHLDEKFIPNTIARIDNVIEYIDNTYLPLTGGLVTGNVQIDGNLVNNNNATFNKQVTFNDMATLGAGASLAGNEVQINANTLVNNSPSTHNNTATFNEDITFNKNVTFGEDAVLSGNKVQIDANTLVNNAVSTHNKAATFNGETTFNSPTTLGAGASLAGDKVQINAAALVNNSPSTHNQAATFNGNATFNSPTTLGAGANLAGDEVQINASTLVNNAVSTHNQAATFNNTVVFNEQATFSKDLNVAGNVNATAINGLSFWVGTQAQYDAISSKSANTLYFIKEQ